MVSHFILLLFWIRIKVHFFWHLLHCIKFTSSFHFNFHNSSEATFTKHLKDLETVPGETERMMFLLITCSQLHIFFLENHIIEEREPFATAWLFLAVWWLKWHPLEKLLVRDPVFGLWLRFFSWCLLLLRVAFATTGREIRTRIFDMHILSFSE